MITEAYMNIRPTDSVAVDTNALESIFWPWNGFSRNCQLGFLERNYRVSVKQL